MNPELQKTLQVAVFPEAIDAYMLIVLLVLVIAGLLGGVANYFLSDRLPELVRRDWAKYPLLGVIAALTVPLFLNMISSNLLETARARPGDLFIFTGFCLIYVIASRRLFENVAGKLLTQVDQLKREIKEIKEIKPQHHEAPHDERLSVPEIPPAPAKSETPKESLSYDDIEILRALAEEGYVYGNFVGLTERTEMSRDLLSTRLIVLRNLGIIETRINERNVLHWFVTSKGQQLLGDFLSRKNNRQTA